MQADKPDSSDDKKASGDDADRNDGSTPRGPDPTPRRSIDLTWAVERESQRLYDMLQDARRASDKEAADDRALWLDARDKEVAEAYGVEQGQSGNPSTLYNGLGVDLNGDGPRNHVTSSGLTNGQSNAQHVSGSGGSSGNSNFSRDSSAGAAANGGGRGGPPDGSQRRSEEINRRRERDEEWYLSVVERIDADNVLVEEMCHQFFARVHPYQLMFHQPTFGYRRYLDRVPSALLHIIYAFAVRFMHHTIFVPPSITEANAHFPAHARGEVLASRAKQEANAWLRASGIAKGDNLMEGINKRRSDPGYKLTWLDTEMIQAICLIGLYEQSMGRPYQSGQYLGKPSPCRFPSCLGSWLTTGCFSCYTLDIAIELARPRSPELGELPLDEEVANEEQQAATLVECRARTLWMLYLADVSASADGRVRRLTDAELASTPLPGGESSWHRFGGNGSNKPRATFGTKTPVTNHDVGEFGHCIRIVSWFRSQDHV